MANGTMDINGRTYEAGEVASIFRLDRYGLQGQYELRGDPVAPALIFDGYTTKPDHRFRFTVAFVYKPDTDVQDGVPFGFHFTAGLIGLKHPQLGLDGQQAVEFAHDIASTIQAGEAEFIRVEQFATRARAAVDQAAAAMRARGEL